MMRMLRRRVQARQAPCPDYLRKSDSVPSAYNSRVEIALRPFRRHDFNALWKIDQECFPVSIAYSKHELSAYIQRKGSFALVAEAAADARGEHGEDHADDADKPLSGIVGFIVAEASARGIGHIITVDVLPLARRSGAGSKLLGAAEDWLRAAKCVRARLEAAVDNAAALLASSVCFSWM